MEDAEDGGLRGLYGALGQLEERAQAAESLRAYATAPGHLPAPHDLPSTYRHLRHASGQLSAARVQAAALARAEARLDAELAAKVFALATRVLDASRSVTDRQELAARMGAFRDSVAALRAQLEPPHGAGAVPSPAPEVRRSATDILATRASIEEGIAAAAGRLGDLRRVAVRQASALLAEVDRIERRRLALTGEIEEPRAPSSPDALLVRLGDAEEKAAARDAFEAARAADIRSLETEFNDAALMPETYHRLRDDVMAVRSQIKAAELAAGELPGSP
eukprot:jgi/Tetstr1/454010/TSEL_040929.t1